MPNSILTTTRILKPCEGGKERVKNAKRYPDVRVAYLTEEIGALNERYGESIADLKSDFLRK